MNGLGLRYAMALATLTIAGVAGCGSISTHRPDPEPSCAPQPAPDALLATPADDDTLRSEIQTLGVLDYEATFTNVYQSAPRTFVVTETQHDPALVTAIAALPHAHGVMVVEKIVPRSLADLAALSRRLLTDATLARDGLAVDTAQPDAIDDTVEIDLYVKGCEDLPISTLVLARARTVLDTRYGKGVVTISPIGTGRGMPQ